MPEKFGFVLMALGIFLMIASLCDWNWFMNNWKVSVAVEAIGRKNARIFYIIIGFISFVIGSLLVLRIVSLS